MKSCIGAKAETSPSLTASLCVIVVTCWMKKWATESGSHNGAQVVDRCSHGVYRAPGDTKSWGCVQCFPDGHDAGPSPVLPRSSADPLNAARTAKQSECTQCGGLRTYSSTNCRACGTPFPIDDAAGRVQGSANAHAAGTCPSCGSAVHYEISKSRWQCSDCDTIYPAPARKAAR